MKVVSLRRSLAARDLLLDLGAGFFGNYCELRRPWEWRMTVNLVYCGCPCWNNSDATASALPDCPAKAAKNLITSQHLRLWCVTFRWFTNRWSLLPLWVTEKCLCFRLLNRCPRKGKSMPGTYPTTFLSSKSVGMKTVLWELLLSSYMTRDWSVRRSKEGQPFCNSVSKVDRAAELDRVLSLRGRARAGWLKLPEQRETQLEGLKDVFLNPDEFHALLGTMGSYSQHWSLYALTTELQRAQMRSWYVQIVGDNCPHNELIPLRGSLESPQEAVKTLYFSVSTWNRWLFAHTCLWECRAVEMFFSCVLDAKTPKFIFTCINLSKKCSQKWT